MRIKGMIVVAIPLIALIGVTSASLALQLRERQVRSVAITASTLNTTAQQVLSDALNAETGVRGYTATRDPLFLQPYDMILARVAHDRAAFRAAAVAERDSGAERASAATMTEVMARLAGLRSSVGAGTPPAALTAALASEKITMDTPRSPAWSGARPRPPRPGAPISRRRNRSSIR
jgi:hypothetical protein